MGKPWNVATQAVSSMNYFFLRAISGKENISVINQELEGFINAMATNNCAVDPIEHASIIKEITDGDYFKGEPIEHVERVINEAIVRLTGDEHRNVAHYYTRLVQTAQEGV